MVFVVISLITPGIFIFFETEHKMKKKDSLVAKICNFLYEASLMDMIYPKIKKHTHRIKISAPFYILLIIFSIYCVNYGFTLKNFPKNCLESVKKFFYFLIGIAGPIMAAIIALYVGYEARKITREQKEIAKSKLALDFFDKKMKFHTSLFNYIKALEKFSTLISQHSHDNNLPRQIKENSNKLMENGDKILEERIIASIIYPNDQMKKIDEIFSLETGLPIKKDKTCYTENEKTKIKDTIKTMNKLKDELECFIKNDLINTH